MINYNEPEISDLLTKCMVVWSLGGEQIALTAEEAPPTCNQVFCKDGCRYRVIAVCGPYSYRWAHALLQRFEVPACA